MAANRKQSPRRGPLIPLLALLLVLGCAVAVFGSWSEGSLPAAGSIPPADQEIPSGQTVETGEEEYRAVWLTYLEYQQMDLSSEESFRAAISTAFDQIAAMGANTVIAHLRPFSDAMYPSACFPWSHLLTGVQGQDPGYDPLAVMIEEAHSRSLRLEGMINPYRIRGSATVPSELASNNPAALWQADPDCADWVVAQGDGLYYNPAIPEVRQLIVDGVREVCENYEIDGIQFDDYFYPSGADDSFDQAAYDRFADGADRADWRRENVNALVRAVWAAVKEIDPEITFGISPQGNNDNNYNTQYSDVALWMEQGGYVDYVMPQIYWGFDYRTSGGQDRYAFQNCLDEWLALPRAAEVKLYVGLGAYRIGVGDGGSNDQAEWSSGENLARQITALRSSGADGYGLYSYRWLFWSDQPVAAQEVAALTRVNQAE